MPDPSAGASKTGSRRWPRRLAILALLLLLILALPFLFTTAIVRMALRSSALAPFRPEIASARLGISGSLVVQGMKLHEPDTGEVLVTAQKVTAQFRWYKVRSEIDLICAEGVEAHVRAGMDAPISLTRLFRKHEGRGRSYWIQNAVAYGRLRIEGSSPVKTTRDHLPLALRLRMEGSRSDPQPHLDLALGATAVREGGDDDPRAMIYVGWIRGEVVVRGVDLQRWNFQLDEKLLASLPPGLQRVFEEQPNALTLRVDRLHADGRIWPHETPPRVAGTLRVLDLNVDARRNGKSVGLLQRFTVSASGEAALVPGGMASVTSAPARFSRLERGAQVLRHASVEASLAGGVLTLKDMQFGYAAGRVSGDLQYDLGSKRFRAAQIELAGLDAQHVVPLATGGRIEAQGKLSGRIHVSTSGNVRRGEIDVVADGPGKLAIKDQNVAEKLAAPLSQVKTPEAPAGLKEIVMAQLRNYPWAKAQVHIRAGDGAPLLRLDATRQPLQEGEPGYGVETTIAGQKTKVNYPLQIPGLEVALPHETLESLLGRILGFRDRGAGTKPAAP